MNSAGLCQGYDMEWVSLRSYVLLIVGAILLGIALQPLDFYLGLTAASWVAIKVHPRVCEVLYHSHLKYYMYLIIMEVIYVKCMQRLSAGRISPQNTVTSILTWRSRFIVYSASLGVTSLISFAILRFITMYRHQGSFSKAVGVFLAVRDSVFNLTIFHMANIVILILAVSIVSMEEDQKRKRRYYLLLFLITLLVPLMIELMDTTLSNVRDIWIQAPTTLLLSLCVPIFWELRVRHH